MKCPTCQAALPEDAAFCGHCGGALRSERTCARCGRSNSPEMRFCLGCGAALSPASPPQPPRAYTPKHLVEKILTSRSALEGERKQVTVLFADAHEHPTPSPIAAPAVHAGRNLAQGWGGVRAEEGMWLIA